jgi:chromosome segregation ATPase
VGRYEQDSSLDSIVEELNGRLVRETSRVHAHESRIEELSRELQANQRELQACRQECRSIRDELEIVEQKLGATSSSGVHEIQLPGKRLLYIGGRATRCLN